VFGLKKIQDKRITAYYHLCKNVFCHIYL